ncbi:uncharacterized protein LOC136083001 [Hydra vulgaris]|uniref:Uncharacterized protein LOC136083001 n=1 Tax=Hydra vulgaris TaxID=6087 RepID=A0ABM4CA21_HYDVU
MVITLSQLNNSETRTLVNKVAARRNNLSAVLPGTRKLRQQCLDTLKSFIASCTDLVPPAQIRWFDIILRLLEKWFSSYRNKAANDRMKKIMKYLAKDCEKEQLKTNKCLMCSEDLLHSDIAQTRCKFFCFVYLVNSNRIVSDLNLIKEKELDHHKGNEEIMEITLKNIEKLITNKLEERKKSILEETERLLKNQEKNFTGIFSANLKIHTNRLDKIQKEVDTNKSKVLSIEKDLRDFKESLNFQEISITKKLNQTTKRYEKEINNLNKKALDLENWSRRNNLRIDGIYKKRNDNWAECENVVKEMFKNQLKIKNDRVIEKGHRIGPPKEDKKPRTIVQKLLNFQDKTKILYATKNLRGTGIYVNEDFAKETIENRKSCGIQSKSCDSKLLLSTARWRKRELEHVFTAKSYCERTWTVLKAKTGKQKTCSSSLPQMLKVDNNSLYEAQIIAHEFNRNFTEIGLTLSRKIPNTQTSFYDFLVPIDKDICSEELSAELLFDGASIHQGNFPERLKLARVIPIHKEGDRSNISNYRPISVLSIFSNILERIIFNRVYNYFNYNNLFHDNQYGFRKGSSTEHAIIQFIHNISESFYKSQYTLGVFIDLSKAFDTVNHRILIKKIKHYGLNNKIIKWFKSYLTNRKQLVYSSDGQQIEPLSITCGVPQGSILGPLLFLIYVNDLSNASKLKSIMFTDDTNIFLSHTDVYELFQLQTKNSIHFLFVQS